MEAGVIPHVDEWVETYVSKTEGNILKFDVWISPNQMIQNAVLSGKKSNPIQKFKIYHFKTEHLFENTGCLENTREIIAEMENLQEEFKLKTIWFCTLFQQGNSK